MILHVTDAKYAGDYRVEVVFNDGRKGIAIYRSVEWPCFRTIKGQSSIFKIEGG
ncbi:MAG: hypothetical protein MRJ65_04645 [Candidatus Brocadiaceae bacterium]|nr:hypothetical protein [Candidatus Brocadiaceae bacterium]